MINELIMKLQATVLRLYNYRLHNHLFVYSFLKDDHSLKSHTHLFSAYFNTLKKKYILATENITEMIGFPITRLH